MKDKLLREFLGITQDCLITGPFGPSCVFLKRTSGCQHEDAGYFGKLEAEIEKLKSRIVELEKRTHDQKT